MYVSGDKATNFYVKICRRLQDDINIAGFLPYVRLKYGRGRANVSFLQVSECISRNESLRRRTFYVKKLAQVCEKSSDALNMYSFQHYGART